MFSVDDGTDIDGLVEGIADPQFFHASFDTGMNIGKWIPEPTDDCGTQTCP